MFYTNKNLPVRNSGFSLIEALVAFMIISVGMLGIASLQTISMKAGHTAITRTSAVFNVEDILDRMRANPTQAAAYVVDVAGMGADGSCSDAASFAAPNIVAAAATSCAPDVLAADDIYRWKRSLPKNATASIAVTPTASAVLNTVTVTIIWKERAVEGTNVATANNYTVTVEM